MASALSHAGDFSHTIPQMVPVSSESPSPIDRAIVIGQTDDMRVITIEELHRATEKHVRDAAIGVPVVVTDNGNPLAVLVNPSLVRCRPRTRTLLPEFQTMMAKRPGAYIQVDLDAMRDDR
jgi:hypothetical protein